jgi:hypothetical protein
MKRYAVAGRQHTGNAETQPRTARNGCPECSATGAIWLGLATSAAVRRPCPKCFGTKYVETPVGAAPPTGTDVSWEERVPCPECGFHYLKFVGECPKCRRR